MLLDVLGSTRTTLTQRASNCRSKVSHPDTGWATHSLWRAGDRRLQLFALNEECLVSACHQRALIMSLPFVHTARRCYRRQKDRGLRTLPRRSDRATPKPHSRGPSVARPVPPPPPPPGGERGGRSAKASLTHVQAGDRHAGQLFVRMGAMAWCGAGEVWRVRHCRAADESGQCPAAGGSKSRNKVAVGEPVAGSLPMRNADGAAAKPGCVVIRGAPLCKATPNSGAPPFTTPALGTGDEQPRPLWRVLSVVL